MVKPGPGKLATATEVDEELEAVRSLEDMQRATLNLLEDFDAEKNGLEEFQRASLNLLEDLNEERGRFEQSQRAMINILDDAREERETLENLQKASLNILEDFNGEKMHMEEVQKATLNILEDFDQEKQKATEAYGALQREVEARKEAEKSRFRLAAIVDSADDAIFSKSLDGIILSWNTGAEKLYGYTAKEALGRHISFMVPEGHADEIADFLDKIQKDERVEHFETDRFRKDGSIVNVALTLSPIKNDAGMTVAISTIARDITERKLAEERLRKAHHGLEQRSNELKRSNEELEAFSYSVSHDLRAPLRAIQGYSEVLTEDYGEVLDDEGKRVAGIIIKNVRKMGILIDDILEFSRLGRRPAEMQVVNMAMRVRETFNELVRSEPDRDIRLELGELKDAYGDDAMITQLVTNLISNAIKYTRPRAAAEIGVSGGETEHGYVYRVEDNGVGFEDAYGDKLFGVFQRLHKERDFEGTGVGLAIAHRIVIRHKGRIWGTGTPNEGATFYFTLGAELQKNDTSSWGECLYE